MIESINLPSDRFSDKKFKGLKEINFIYGKNGTGKTSITRAISEQCEGEHDVHVFRGFEGVVGVDGKLNSIILGKENVDLQSDILQIESEISTLGSDLNADQEGSIAYKFKKAEQEFYDQEKKINKFYTQSASSISNEHVEWTGKNYNKKLFKEDISIAQKLSENEYSECEQLFNQNPLTPLREVRIDSVNTSSYLEKVNGILQTEVIRSASLSFRTSAVENWVKDGLKIYEDKPDNKDICDFCGGEVTEERINTLSSYFNEEVKNLEEEIDRMLSEITRAGNILSSLKVPLVEKTNIFPKYLPDFEEKDNRLNKLKDEYQSFLRKLVEELQNKKRNIFTAITPIKCEIPEDFSDLQEEYNDLVKLNNEFGEDLVAKRNGAKEKLRLHEVAKKIETWNYESEKNELSDLERSKEKVELAFRDKNDALQEAMDKLRELKAQTRSEQQAADEINKKLGMLGERSFRLVTLPGNQQTQGQYYVENTFDNSRRKVDSLSTGEKNTVAFLWFNSNLRRIDNDSQHRPKIIIFDDPMTSNDDTAQYLIISELVNLIKNNKSGGGQIFILTHNIHFYLNTRYNWNYSDGKKATFHLHKLNGHTYIKPITKGNEDLKTSYNELWVELHWLFDKEQSNFMLNPARRIFETYMKFNCLSIEELYRGDIEAKKLFDVNSHSIDDLEAELNGKSCEDILKKIEGVFHNLGADSHFKKHWNSTK